MTESGELKKPEILQYYPIYRAPRGHGDLLSLRWYPTR
jgi:hypothetical protein